MSQVYHQIFFQLIFYLCWTTKSVSSQELNNNQNSGTNEINSGSTYFFYQQPDYLRDCAEAANRCSSSNLSGVILIKPDGYPEPFEVYCDNAVDSGGWTVIHRIQDGSVMFNRNWTEYKIGFGFISQEFWIGNEKLSFLTNQNSYELRIDLTSADGLSFYVTYNMFRISDEYSDYKLTSVGTYGGTEDKINTFLCPQNTEGVVYTSLDCSQQCSCTNGQFTCDDAHRCSPNAVCEERNDLLGCYCNTGYTGDGVNCSPSIESTSKDCQDIYDRVSTESGVYKIKPTTWQGEPFDVYCNMTDGGGWTVFQRRVDGSQDFFLYWSNYTDGFGTPDRELWLGNDKLHSLTTQNNYELRIDFVNSLGNPFFAKYSSFSISDVSDNYRLSLGSYISESDAGDSLSYHNGQAFTTRDRDNDQWTSGNCATDGINRHLCEGNWYHFRNGAWWYNVCDHSSLNSPYGNGFFRWTYLPSSNCNIIYTEMKVRRI